MSGTPAGGEGELRLGLRLNRIRREVEAAHIAVLRLGHPHLEVVAHTQIERELFADAPVVMDEQPWLMTL